MGHTALALGDQLSHANPALDGADRVLIVESRAAMSRVRLHRQRRHLVLSAMRHFAAELRERGQVEVVERRGAARIGDAIAELGGEVVCAEPNSIPSRTALARAGRVRFIASSRFLTAPADFAAWAEGRRRLVMEDFYRDQRRRFDLLVADGGRPEGGRWNLDRENRRPGDASLSAPAPWLPEEDEIDAGVRADLDAMGIPETGHDGPRIWPATHAEALRTLEDFVEHRLAGFGGVMMTKPYAGGGNYIDRMSTYCGDCRYEPRSCPVTALYWDFMARHRDAFAPNRRMRGPLAGLRRMDEGRLAAPREQAEAWAGSLGGAG